MDRILQIENISKTYGKGDNKTQALNGISFEVLKGEFLGIMGASGSGKTTLLNCIATMTKPSSGRMFLNGKDISSVKRLDEYRGQEIGYLFQEFELLDNLTAKENILLPLSLRGVTGNKAEKPLFDIVSLLDIKEVMDKFPAQMSGGQKQRVAAARALITGPSVVLADEPTGSLDSKNSKTLMKMLSDINQQQEKSIVMVTHDANAASYCSRILFIQDGCIFHELRKNVRDESSDDFYKRIVTVMSQLGGGSANVF